MSEEQAKRPEARRRRARAPKTPGPFPHGSDWTRHFFDGLANRFWRAALPPQLTEAEAAWLHALFSETAHGKTRALLDVPCGHGRHAIALAARGWRVTGIDLSNEELDAARAATPSGVKITWKPGDMSRLSLPAKRFDGAYCFGNSFGYLSLDRMHNFVATVASALKQGARFVIDTPMVAEAILPNLEARTWVEAGGVHAMIENGYDVATSTLESRFTFLADGSVERKTAFHAVYGIAELSRMLARHGLAVERLDGSLDGTAFQLGDPRLLLVAVKI
ncbi:MAG: Methyltransferase type 11 [Rhodospirillales bacterium]|nr:Methyltransferase type 11 [Rhodospirillales bacterium]